MSWIRIQLKSQKTISIPLDQYLTMSDSEFEDLMNSEYGYFIEDPYASDSSYDIDTINDDSIIDIEED